MDLGQGRVCLSAVIEEGRPKPEGANSEMLLEFGDHSLQAANLDLQRLAEWCMHITVPSNLMSVVEEHRYRTCVIL